MSIQKEDIDLERLPKHLAIIMDGNGRWAKRKGAKRIFGHQNAIKAVREATEGAAELGVEVLTLYAFSTENWSRPKEEVDALMELLVKTISKEMDTLQKNNISLVSIGDRAALPEGCRNNLEKAISETAGNKRMKLNLALNYSGRWDIAQATKRLAEDYKKGILETIDDTTIEKYLTTAGLPDPELLIRTSGEMRISNFLLWEMAYTELYFTDLLWPDFRKHHLYEALVNYQGRERRFGKTSEQLLKTLTKKRKLF